MTDLSAGLSREITDSSRWTIFSTAANISVFHRYLPNRI